MATAQPAVTSTEVAPKSIVEAVPFQPPQTCCESHAQKITVQMYIRFGSPTATPVWALIDTGCATTTVKKSFLEANHSSFDIKECSKDAHPISMQALFGSKTLEENAEVDIHIDGKLRNGHRRVLKVNTLVLVDEDLQFDVLLGNNVLVPQGALLDTVAKTVQFQACKGLKASIFVQDCKGRRFLVGLKRKKGVDLRRPVGEDLVVEARTLRDH